MNPFLTPVGSHTRNATISSAVTISTPAGAAFILIQALAQNVRFTLDGQTPTASLGYQLKAGDPPLLIPVRLSGGSKVIDVKVIQEAATGEVQYQFMG